MAVTSRGTTLLDRYSRTGPLITDARDDLVSSQVIGCPDNGGLPERATCSLLGLDQLTSGFE